VRTLSFKMSEVGDRKWFAREEGWVLKRKKGI
jgi:hypothetical protein